MIASGRETATVEVIGSGFRTGTVARWTPANAKDPLELSPSAVQVIDTRTLKLKLVPGEPGAGTLMLMTPNGFSAVAAVIVV